MTQLVTTKNKPLSRVLAAIPQWIKNHKTRGNYSRYSREGMSDMVIPMSPIKLDETAYKEAKQVLDYLLKLSSFPLTIEIVRETFTLVNGIIVNPLREEDFNFKVSAIYSVFSNYPACVFNNETARQLATLNKFFPSGNEIEQVLKTAKDALDAEISNLQSIVGHGFFSKEDQIQEHIEKRREQEERRREKEEAEYQHRVRKLQNRLQPIDNLILEIEKIVAMYVPKNGHRMDHDALIHALQQSMNQIDDPKIKSILKEKIGVIQSAKRQLEQLTKAGIIQPQKAFA